MAISESTGEKIFLGFLASLAVGGTMWWMQSRLRYVDLHTSQLFQPDAAKNIANSLPYEIEDDFLLSAWDFVGRDIAYEPLGSKMDFNGDIITCAKCYMPEETLSRGRANCVGKSILYASIIVNKIPANRVNIVVGELAHNGVGGHAWVELYRNGSWYLIETTKPPPSQPWVKANDMYSIYIPAVYLSESEVSCGENTYCVKFNEHSCLIPSIDKSCGCDIQ